MGPVLVEEVCQSGLQFVQQSARKKNIHLSLRLDADVRHVVADGRRLKQMLINLLNNAVKFTPEGGRVGLEVVRRGGDETPKEVLFTVWDNGIGIAPEKQAQLFEPFVQLDGSLSRKYEGTGLGLALVHAMAELHGGSVSIESAGLGQGSRFTVALPWVPPPVPRSAGESSAAASGFESFTDTLGRPPLIMAVDDNTMTLTVLTSFLEAMSCKVMTARDGTEALVALEGAAPAARPDLVLLDIQLPGIDGLTVVRRVRAAGLDLPIVALTALAMPGDRERCLEAGANDYLSKPVRLDDLTRVIKEQLTHKAF
jgi:CheY-like chemotaxis protein/anti-sigma regulatory factor (Ser/Thr protein kinase)